MYPRGRFVNGRDHLPIGPWAWSMPFQARPLAIRRSCDVEPIDEDDPLPNRPSSPSVIGQASIDP